MSSSSASSPEARARTAAIVVAGGKGSRVGGDVRKQYLELLGEPILLRAIRPFVDHPGIEWTVVVLPPEDAADPPDWLRREPVRVVAGGEERGDSVWNGLMGCHPEAEHVLVHDGARPFVSIDLIDRVLGRIDGCAVVAALPATDTIKVVEGDLVVATPDRSRLWSAQTPQGFPRAMLETAHRRAREDRVAATDDAALCERLGLRVVVVPGSEQNLKVTRPTDLLVAEALARTLPGRGGSAAEPESESTGSLS